MLHDVQSIDPSLTFIFFGLVSLCLLVTTITFVLTARDFRQMMRRMSAVLVSAEKTLRETHQLFHRLSGAVRHVETLVHEACDAASETAERIMALKARAQEFLAHQFGNGARAEPRSHHRRSR